MTDLLSQTGPVPVASVEQLFLRKDALVIDLRSPSEYADDHVTGAHSVPLFDDDARALIGLHYKQSSPSVAFEKGRGIVARDIERLVADIARIAGWTVPENGLAGDLGARVLAMTEAGIELVDAELEPVRASVIPERPVVLHCWRGGLRSRSVVSFLRALGFDQAVGLEGGYKAYRRHVMESIEAWQAPPAYVLRGLTGVGKTLVLRALEGMRPRWTFDLEAQAGHRSSLLGMVGLEPCNQKTFESRIAARLREGFPGPVVLEGESRKVGDALIPRGVWEPLADGVNIELVAPSNRRVRVLMEDYLATDANRPKLREQLAAIEPRMERRVPLVELFDAGREEELVELLLEHYYDPLYRHGEKRKTYAHTVDATDPEQAAAQIATWIEAR